MVEGLAIPFGLSDPRLGAISKVETCRTCEKSFKDCKGHFSTIELEKLVLNILYLKHLLKLIDKFCNSCGSLLDSTKTCLTCNTKNKVVFCSSIGLFYREGVYWPLEEVRQFLSKIINEDLQKIKLFDKGVRPEWTISFVIPVPPIKTRPTIFLESGARAEDDLTYKLIDIIKTNLKIKTLKEQELESPINEVAMLLQYHYVTYLDNNQPRVPISKHRNGRPLRCLSSRISGKEGRIRGNLGGKRTNHSARAIIVPDSFLEINEVGIPQEIANQLTKKVIVTEENRKEIEKELLKEKSKITYLYSLENEGFKVLPQNKKELLLKLVPGAIIKRSLINGDYFLLNRQPSLHRHSIQGHKIKITSEKRNVFPINPLVCYPYNADFDGDEMNIHIVQDFDAEREIIEKTDVLINSVSEKSGLPILGLTKDYISGLHLLSTYEEKIDLSLFYPYLTNNKKDKSLLTGSEILGLCLPKDFFFSQQDLIIEKGMVFGEIKKKHLAPENNSLGYFLLSQYGSEKYTSIITLLSRVSCLFEDYLGLTVPISFFNLASDEKKNSKLEKKKNLIAFIEKDFTNKVLIENFRNNLKKEYLQILDESKVNNIMITCGSSGFTLNVTQIYAAVGQQNVYGGTFVENPLLKNTIYPFFKNNNKNL